MDTKKGDYVACFIYRMNTKENKPDNPHCNPNFQTTFDKYGTPPDTLYTFDEEKIRLFNIKNPRTGFINQRMSQEQLLDSVIKHKLNEFRCSLKDRETFGEVLEFNRSMYPSLKNCFIGEYYRYPFNTDEETQGYLIKNWCQNIPSFFKKDEKIKGNAFKDWTTISGPYPVKDWNALYGNIENLQKNNDNSITEEHYSFAAFIVPKICIMNCSDDSSILINYYNDMKGIRVEVAKEKLESYKLIPKTNDVIVKKLETRIREEIPNREMLEKQISELGYWATGMLHGVSENTIGEWIKM